MKKTLFLVLLSVIAVSLHATIINVSNNAVRPAGYQQYLQIAIDNATAGDTIYVYPSSTSYGNITVTKKLYFFGAGYSGSASTSYESALGNVALDTTTSPSSNPSGSCFMGFKIGYFTANKQNITNITLYGNFLANTISLSSNCNNWLIGNNHLISDLNINNSGSIIISNNVIVSGNINNSTAPSVVITNNLFFRFGYSTTMSNITNATISNNIFLVQSTPNLSSLGNCVFLNNLTWFSSTQFFTLPGSGNSGSGNINNTQPVFAGGTYDNTNFISTVNYYQLASGSPGKSAGTDGTDVGIYGGTNPFVWQTAASIPRITNMTITNPVINQATPINVKVKAKKATL